MIAAPKKVLAKGAVYWADNGRRICSACAGMSALYTGRDISGQKVERATVADAGEWERAIRRPLACEKGCTTLSTIAGPNGWPAAKGGGR